MKIDAPVRLLCLAAVSGCMLSMVASDSMAEPAENAKTHSVKVGDITLEVPESWKKLPTRSTMRLAQFELPKAAGDKEPPELGIFFFGGESGGGIRANLDRWRDQFESKGRTSKFAKATSAQGDYVLADVQGTFNKPIGPPILGKTEPLPDARMLAVILTVKDKGNYFLKLTGPQKSVAAAADGFRASFGGDAKKEKEHKE